VRLGAVTDFIEPTHYPAFNVADSAIVVSVAALLLMAWFERSAPDADAAEPDAATEGSR
jgi:lipoprotein signal peptidase